jgi:hypothetical protein
MQHNKVDSAHSFILANVYSIHKFVASSKVMKAAASVPKTASQPVKPFGRCQSWAPAGWCA